MCVFVFNTVYKPVFTLNYQVKGIEKKIFWLVFFFFTIIITTKYLFWHYIIPHIIPRTFHWNSCSTFNIHLCVYFEQYLLDCHIYFFLTWDSKCQLVGSDLKTELYKLFFIFHSTLIRHWRAGQRERTNTPLWT